MAHLQFQGRIGGPQDVIAAPVAVAVVAPNWQDLTAELEVSGVFSIALWVELTINDSTDVRVRAVGLHATGGVEYTIPTETDTANVVTLEASYYEFNVDADQNQILSWQPAGLFPIIKFQIQAGVLGVNPADFETAIVTTGAT